jgi:hypothetical protein
VHVARSRCEGAGQLLSAQRDRHEGSSVGGTTGLSDAGACAC